MKRTVLILLLMLSVASQAELTATEDITKIGVGARPMGMGKAFVAIANDGNAPFMNPAGLAEIDSWQFTSMYVNMLEGDVPYTLISSSYPLRYGNLGVGLISTGVSDIPAPGPTSISYFDYYDRVFLLSYAAPLSSRNRAPESRDLFLGGNLKLFTKGFTGVGDNAATGIDLDLGVKYIYSPSLSLGANLQNILPSTLNWTSSARENIPLLVKMGGAAKLFDERLTLALDMDMPAGREHPMLYHLGVEWPATDFFSLRGGFDQIASAANTVSTNPTAGLGIDIRGFKIDYAYHPYQEASTDIAHYISFSFFPDSDKKPKKKVVKAPKEPEIFVPPFSILIEGAERQMEMAPPKKKERIIYHKVRPGENLRIISCRYLNNGELYKQVAKMNYIMDPNKIRTGQIITIDTAQIDREEVREVGRYVMHCVGSGDTLYGLAKKYLGDSRKYMEIVKMNKLKKPYRLWRGQKLRIYIVTPKE